jgi:hypothetical protein
MFEMHLLKTEQSSSSRCLGKSEYLRPNSGTQTGAGSRMGCCPVPDRRMEGPSIDFRSLFPETHFLGQEIHPQTQLV